MKTTIIAALVTALCASCVSVTVTEPSACDDQLVDFGTAPVIPSSVISAIPVGGYPITLPPQSVTFDLSDTINKVGDVGANLQVTVESLMIGNVKKAPLSWITSVDVQITGNDDTTPQAEFGSAGPSLNVHVTMDSVAVLRYLQSGPVTMTFTASGDLMAADVPPAGTELATDVDLCVAIVGHVNK